ncbi:hypothetical protein ACJX0J_007607, partial [Zea mays]
DMYISKVKSTKVTQKMDKIVREILLLTSSKLEKMPRDWHFHLIIIYIFEIFCFLFYDLDKINAIMNCNKRAGHGLNYTSNPGFKEKRYGLDRTRIKRESHSTCQY